MLLILKGNNHIVIKFWGIKIKFKGVHTDILLIDFYRRLISIFIPRKNYKIIPIGTYCFPRCITTFNKLKPRRQNGEKTCPFDLAFFNDFDKILELIDTHFENFYRGLFFNTKCNYWHNGEFSAWFNHDGELDKKEFIRRYDTRINNFYEYLKSSKHVYLLVATKVPITKAQTDKLNTAITKYRKKESFDIIIINQSEKENNINYDNVYTIEQCHNVEKFNKMNKDYDWVGGLLFHHDVKEAKVIYKEVTLALIKIIIKTHLSFK